MSKELKSIGLDAESLKLLQKVKEMQDSGQELDKETQEALKAIDLAGEFVDAIMSGKIVDLAYLKLFSSRTKSRLNIKKETYIEKKVPKNSRLYRKMMRDKKLK